VTAAVVVPVAEDVHQNHVHDEAEQADEALLLHADEQADREAEEKGDDEEDGRRGVTTCLP